MVTRLIFPAVLSLPDVPYHVLESALSSREWQTYSIGVRSREPFLKESLSKTIHSRLSNLALFRSKEKVAEFPDVEIILDEVEQKVFIQIAPIIITGKYTKLVRTIAQTRHYCYECKGTGVQNGEECFVCHGQKVLTKESVQELIAPFFQKAFVCGDVLFHGAGREDVDVRMLGEGRPFALTLENPLKRNVNVSVVQTEINEKLQNKVQLSHLEIGKPDDVAFITQKYHTKRYRALIECSEKINIEKLSPFLDRKMDVIQTTPSRVEKRRAMKDRPHWVVVEKVKKISENQVEIQLHTSAGCYIKEFISGDEGRSKPSLSEWLGCACACKELDVLEIVEEESHLSFST